jgi:hypothetical protein
MIAQIVRTNRQIQRRDFVADQPFIKDPTVTIEALITESRRSAAHFRATVHSLQAGERRPALQHPIDRLPADSQSRYPWPTWTSSRLKLVAGWPASGLRYHRGGGEIATRSDINASASNWPSYRRGNISRLAVMATDRALVGRLWASTP